MSVCLSSLEQQVVICRGTFNCYASFLFILYFSALLPFWEKAISRVLHASSKTETDRLLSQKILPNFWHTAILTASVGNNNTDGKILKFHSFLDLRERWINLWEMILMGTLALIHFETHPISLIQIIYYVLYLTFIAEYLQYKNRNVFAQF